MIFGGTWGAARPPAEWRPLANSRTATASAIGTPRPAPGCFPSRPPPSRSRRNMRLRRPPDFSVAAAGAAPGVNPEVHGGRESFSYGGRQSGIRPTTGARTGPAPASRADRTPRCRSGGPQAWRCFAPVRTRWGCGQGEGHHWQTGCRNSGQRNLRAKRRGIYYRRRLGRDYHRSGRDAPLGQQAHQHNREENEETTHGPRVPPQARGRETTTLITPPTLACYRALLRAKCKPFLRYHLHGYPPMASDGPQQTWHILGKSRLDQCLP